MAVAASPQGQGDANRHGRMSTVPLACSRHCSDMRITRAARARRVGGPDAGSRRLLLASDNPRVSLQRRISVPAGELERFVHRTRRVEDWELDSPDAPGGIHQQGEPLEPDLAGRLRGWVVVFSAAVVGAAVSGYDRDPKHRLSRMLGLYLFVTAGLVLMAGISVGRVNDHLSYAGFLQAQCSLTRLESASAAVRASVSLTSARKSR
jgi:hypothetical protein